MKDTHQPIRIAALSDIHVTERSHNKYQDLFSVISQKADILALSGDLTDHGLVSEAEILNAELVACTIPKVAVLGNHDYENGQEEEIKHTLRSAGVNLLEDEEFIFEDVGFAGVKGFGGGFGKFMLGSFGEKAMKAFVEEAVQEAEKLELSLSKVDHTEKKVVLMHYSPTPTTLTGEPLEIFPFLGSSRLEEVIDRYEVSAVFHGHAHFGSLEGKTTKGIPVYNVAFPLLQKHTPKTPYKIYNL